MARTSGYPIEPARYRCVRSNFVPSNGLLKKPTAPSLIARARMLSSGNAVMKIMGMEHALGVRSALQLDTGHARHLHVRDDATCVIDVLRLRNSFANSNA